MCYEKWQIQRSMSQCGKHVGNVQTFILVCNLTHAAKDDLPAFDLDILCHAFYKAIFSLLQRAKDTDQSWASHQRIGLHSLLYACSCALCGEAPLGLDLWWHIQPWHKTVRALCQQVDHLLPSTTRIVGFHVVLHKTSLSHDKLRKLKDVRLLKKALLIARGAKTFWPTSGCGMQDHSWGYYRPFVVCSQLCWPVGCPCASQSSRVYGKVTLNKESHLYLFGVFFFCVCSEAVQCWLVVHLVYQDTLIVTHIMVRLTHHQPTYSQSSHKFTLSITGDKKMHELLKRQIGLSLFRKLLYWFMILKYPRGTECSGRCASFYIALCK